MQRFVVALAALLALALPARAYINILPTSPVPDCADPGVVTDVVNRFGDVNAHQWLTGYVMLSVDKVRQTSYLPPTQFTPERRWCQATAAISNGAKSPLYYVIEADRNFAGLGSRITYCLPGYDYWHVYGAACRSVQP